MAPQTRSARSSRGQGHAPASRIYHSSPALRQVHFPARRRAVKTYGHKPKSRAAALKQQTLTQIDYLISTPQDDDEPITLSSDSAEEEEADEQDEEEKRPRKRRRKTEGDAASPVQSTGRYRSQTLTQFVPEWKAETKETKGFVKDSEEEDDEDDVDLEIFFNQIAKGPRRKPTTRSRGGNRIGDAVGEPLIKSQPSSSAPQTPINKRIKKEIPPSDGSPTTPMLERYSPAPHRSPLQGKSPNVVAQFPKTVPAKRPRKLVIQESFATNESWGSPLREIETTPKVSPAKNAKRMKTPSPKKQKGRSDEEEIPDSDEDDDFVEDEDTSNESALGTEVEMPAGVNEYAVEEGRDGMEGEVEDISEMTEEPTAAKAEKNQPAAEEFAEHDAIKTQGHKEEAGEGVGYENVGEETQFVLGQLFDSSERSTSAVATARNKRAASSRGNSSDIRGLLVPDSSPLVAETPRTTRRHASHIRGSEDMEEGVIPSSHGRTPRKRHADALTPQDLRATYPRNGKKTPSRSSAHKVHPSSSPHPRPHTQFYTQGFESQRIPLEVIRAMAPQTNRSDIFISIHPQHVANIIAGVKTHEFRNYRIPQTVARMWIYTTNPASEVRYMASVSLAKQPGEIHEGDDGLGNAEFNAGKKTPFAYELLQVYELNNPVALQGMRERGWLNGPPQKYVYVPPAVVGELMANLRCALFKEREGYEDDEEDNEEAERRGEVSPMIEGPMTVSQELEEQIKSDIVHSTQFSHQPQEVIPCSQLEESPSSSKKAKASAEGEDQGFRRPVGRYSGTRRGQWRSSGVESTGINNSGQVQGGNTIPPSQATTASQASNPALASPDKFSVPRPPQLFDSSLPASIDDSSPVLMHLGLAAGSSQLLPRSQMLTDSLIGDMCREAPTVWDSEAEEEL